MQCAEHPDTVFYAIDAAENGADAVMVGIPYYYPIDSTAVVEHYERVTNAVDIPVYVYHVPARTGNKLDLESPTGSPPSTASPASKTPAATWRGSDRPPTRTPI